LNRPDIQQPRRSDLPPATVLGGKYRLDSKLAEGGMGTVWIATNVVLESQVAIKVLLREHVHSPTAEARLLREARTAAQIGHPNIVQVFDFGKTDDGFPFIVMELLQGEDLGTRLERVWRISAMEAVRIMIPVVSAVAAAHAKGVVHRDLKPQNIFLTTDANGDEIPKVVDFGIAKANGWQHTPKLTMEGVVVGSPEYVSPEQARGQDDIDARADVWALCVTLYETVTGELPFRDENYNRLLRRIIEDDPVSIVSKGAGDDELWAIVRKGLAKNRDERWQSAGELRDALVQWFEQRGGVRTSSGRFGSQPDIRQSGSGVAAVAPSRRDVSTRQQVVAAGDGPPEIHQRARDLSKTSPDYVRRGASRRIAIVVAAAGVLALGVIGMIVVGLLRSRVQETQGPASVSGVTLSASSVASSEPAALVVPDAVRSSPAPVVEPTDPPIASATAPAGTSRPPPPRSTDKKAAPARTRGNPPPLPTEPNF